MSIPDGDTCYRAVSGRDARFDGWFFTAVHSTGIYCRPSCPARTPLRRNVDFYASAAAAHRAGFRACKRCRPDAAPGSPDFDVRGDLAGRALRLINDGVIDRVGVPGLARSLGYSERQLHRTLVAEVGAGPLSLARAQRAQTARILLENSALSMSDLAFAAGFASIRQFNETMLAIFATTPSQLRENAKSTRRLPRAPARGLHLTSSALAAPLELRLAYRRPMNLQASLRYLGYRAVRGIEEYADGIYTRTLRLPSGYAIVQLRAGGEPGGSESGSKGLGSGYVACRLQLSDHRDLIAAVTRVRHLLDLDADPESIDDVLGADPAMAPLVGRRPGLRSPGAVDAMEMAVRAVVGQQVSVAGASTVIGRIVDSLGDPILAADGTPHKWRLFPTAAGLADCDPKHLPLPRRRIDTVQRIAAAIAAGQLDLHRGSDRDQARAALLDLVGVGPWSADYLLMRVLGDPDVLLSSDLIVRRSAESRGIDLASAAKAWAPWGSYASHHLWAASGVIPNDESHALTI